MLRQGNARLASGALRSLSVSSQVSASHYDVLGITPKATQNDIKTAYYELSKVYHPDKSDDEESARKFRAISEAYEVLGNVNLKKMYDKGLLVGQETNTNRTDYRPDPEPTDPTLRFYKSRQKRHMTPTMDGRTPIYNFDAWSRNHYGEILKKNQQDKEFLRKKYQSEKSTTESTRQEVLLYMMFGIGGLFLFSVINGTTDYDKVDSNNRQQIKEIDKR